MIYNTYKILPYFRQSRGEIVPGYQKKKKLGLSLTQAKIDGSFLQKKIMNSMYFFLFQSSVFSFELVHLLNLFSWYGLVNFLNPLRTTKKNLIISFYRLWYNILLRRQLDIEPLVCKTYKIRLSFKKRVYRKYRRHFGPRLGRRYSRKNKFASNFYLIIRKTAKNLYVTFTRKRSGDVLYSASTGTLGVKKRWDRHSSKNFRKLLMACFFLLRKRKLATDFFCYFRTNFTKQYMKTI